VTARTHRQPWSASTVEQSDDTKDISDIMINACSLTPLQLDGLFSLYCIAAANSVCGAGGCWEKERWGIREGVWGEGGEESATVVYSVRPASVGADKAFVLSRCCGPPSVTLERFRGKLCFNLIDVFIQWDVRWRWWGNLESLHPSVNGWGSRVRAESS